MDFQSPTTIHRQELRRFGLVVGSVIAVLFGLFFPWLFEFAIPLWSFVLGGVLVFFGVVAPMLLRPVYIGWMWFGLKLNKITSPLILGTFFFLVFIPVGFIWRFRRDPLKLKFRKDESSYFKRELDSSSSLKEPY